MRLAIRTSTIAAPSDGSTDLPVGPNLFNFSGDRFGHRAFLVAKTRAHKNEFCELIQSDLGCRFSTLKYFAFVKTEIMYSPHRPASTRGAYASSRTWGGMRWTQAVSQDERRWLRTAKSCGPGAPKQALRSRDMSRGRRWQPSDGHRGEHV